MAYTRYLVTNKIALYSHDLQNVMVMEYNGLYSKNGLPGGHLDPGETPEHAMARELMEELGVTIDIIQKRDFFVRNFDEPEETIILAYTAIAPEGLVTSPSNYHAEHGIWVARDDIPSVDMADTYKAFVLENWPESI